MKQQELKDKETQESSRLASEAETPQVAQEILSRMTVEEKVGQMFIARCPEESAAKKAAEYHLGGYIFVCQGF